MVILKLREFLLKLNTFHWKEFTSLVNNLLYMVRCELSLVINPTSSK